MAKFFDESRAKSDLPVAWRLAGSGVGGPVFGCLPEGSVKGVSGLEPAAILLIIQVVMQLIENCPSLQVGLARMNARKSLSGADRRVYDVTSPLSGDLDAPDQLWDAAGTAVRERYGLFFRLTPRGFRLRRELVRSCLVIVATNSDADVDSALRELYRVRWD